MLSDGHPTGIVTFTMPGGSTLRGLLDSHGRASVGTTLTAGVHTVTATYVGDATFAGSSSTPLAQSVRKAATILALVATHHPPIVKHPVTGVSGNAAVLAVPGAAEAAEVTATDRRIPTRTTLTTTPNPSTYGQTITLTATVAASTVATRTTLTTTPNPSSYGQTITLGATVTAPDGGIPQGIVTFTVTDGPTLTARLDANGRASVTIDALPPGRHTVTASYLGHAFFGASRSAPLTQTVSAINVVLTAIPATINFWNQRFFIPALGATLTDRNTGTGLSGRTITFTANPVTGTVILGRALTTPNGRATLTNVMVSPTLITTRYYTANFTGANTSVTATTSLRFNPYL